MFNRFAGDARRIVIVAHEEARDLGSARIDPRHIILGVLLSGEGTARRVLEDAGFTVERVRAELLAESESRGAGGRPGSGREGRGESREGRREGATADTPGDVPPGGDDAASSGGGSVLSDEDAEALRAIGIDLDAVRESIEAQFGPDALSGSADEDAADDAAGGDRDCGRGGDAGGPWDRGRGSGGRRHGGRGRGPWAAGEPGFGGRGHGPGPGGRGPGGRGFGERRFGERGFGERSPGGRGRGPHGRPGRGRFRIGFDDAAKQALATGLRLAVRDSSRELTGSHLLLGVLDGADPATVRLVEEFTAPDDLAARLRDLMGRAA